MITSNLSKRIISGLIIIFLAFCYIYFASEHIFTFISAALVAVAIYEFSLALKKKEIPVKLSATYTITILFLFSLWSFWKDFNMTGAICGALTAAIALYFYFEPDRRKLCFWSCLSLAWISAPFAMLVWFRFGEYYHSASDLILFLVIVVSFNDMFAYFGGKKFGKHPLAPVISPNKTIEGSLFGLSAGLAAGFILKELYLTLSISSWKLFLIISILVVSSQLGDLLESKFKRYCQVKDSGAIIPGHGGLLDRIDSYLLALPVFIGLIHIMEIRM